MITTDNLLIEYIQENSYYTSKGDEFTMQIVRKEMESNCLVVWYQQFYDSEPWGVTRTHIFDIEEMVEYNTWLFNKLLTLKTCNI